MIGVTRSDSKIFQHTSALLAWLAVVLAFAVVPVCLAQDSAGPGRNWWAFRPLQQPDLPCLANSAQVANRIDYFVLSELQGRGLWASAEADRRTLIRRVTFDLTGLPPTPAETADFLGDTSPDAYERLVERLLASPGYGERWGRVWLDMARYSDTRASWLKSTSNAWLYRDWIIQALNRDLPYDDFVRFQLAADLIPAVPYRDQAALGFLGLSPLYWKELRLAPAVIKMVVAEEYDERIDAISRTFLGLTVSCARCHDHKFDPVTMQDYYALAGVLASTRMVDLPMLPEPQATVVRQAHLKVEQLQQEIERLKLAVPAGPADRIAELEAQITHIRQETPRYEALVAHGVGDGSLYVVPDGEDRTKLEYRAAARDLPLYLRGNPSNEGPVVPRRFLAVLSRGEPERFRDGSGRRELAECILRDARPLAARVMVNRIWARHFGRGLVGTPSNFGVQGDPPSHPALLDDLASRFIAHGWSIKWLQREILLSSTYRQSSGPGAERQAIDPENKWLWRMNRRRMDVEAWRDAILQVSGSLQRSGGGPATLLNQSDNFRRTVYGQVARQELDDLLRLYDFPDPAAHSPGRELTTTPLQQLFVLNSPFFHSQSQRLAQRFRVSSQSDLEGNLLLIYQLLYARSPTLEESAIARAFVRTDQASGVAARWEEYVHALLACNEMMYLD